MTRPNRLGQFADVREILDAALSHGGGKLELESHGKAVHWRQRAYRFRKLYAESLPKNHMSVYDALTFPVIKPESATVVINKVETVGKFIPAGSAPIAAPVDPEDELLADALALAARLDGDIL